MLKPSAANLRVAGLVRMSTCDWPGQLAATIFCQGCAWDCVYCHNPNLQPMTSPDLIDWQSIADFLATRRRLLDAVVFTGGEATLQPALAAAMEEVRALGFKIGMHTAGMHPERFRAVLPLADWVGYDVKAPFHLYERITGVPGSGERARANLVHLLASGKDYEVRTTLHSGLLTLDEMLWLKEELLSLGVRNYAVQGFRKEGTRADRLSVLNNAPTYTLPNDFASGFESFVLR